MMKFGLYQCAHLGCKHITYWAQQVGLGRAFPVCSCHKANPPNEISFLALADRPWEALHGGWDGAVADGSLTMAAFQLGPTIAPDTRMQAAGNPVMLEEDKAEPWLGHIWVQIWPTPWVDALVETSEGWHRQPIVLQALRQQDLFKLPPAFITTKGAVWGLVAPKVGVKIPLKPANKEGT